MRSLISVLCVMVVSSAWAGPLNPPPGPVAPTHKTLTEVEPRTAINAVNTPGDADSQFRIDQPGSYYLTGNIVGVAAKRGIEITSEGVVIDLMGFEVRGAAGSLEGIRSFGVIATVVRNGRVSYWGGNGIHLEGNSAIVENVVAELNGGWGIFFNNSFPGSRITGCISGQNTLGCISASQACIVERCIAYASGSVPGIVASSASRVEHCSIWNCNPGILLGPSNGASGAFDNSMFQCAVGILVSGTDARVERNHVRVNSGSVGLRATAATNSFVDNVVTGTGDKYDFVAGNRLRLIVSQIPESIDWPAEVVLAGTLTGSSGQSGITVNADDVTIDLGGHALQGVAGSVDGITVAGSRRNIAVRNGAVRGWAGDGVDLSGASSAIVEDLRVSDNTGAGVRAGERAIVRDCDTRSNGSDNIVVGGYSQIVGCVADASTGGHGINASFVHSLVRGCTANVNAMSGIRASQRTLVQDCVASNNTLHGVHITFAGTVEDCLINSNGGDGILVDAGGVVTIRNNNVSESAGTGDVGIRATVAGCHIEGNHVTLCHTGYAIPSAPNVVVRNTAIANTTNFSIAAGNTAGPVVTPGTAAAATNPLANYSN